MVHEGTTLLQLGWAAIKGGACAIDSPIKSKEGGGRDFAVSQMHYKESGSLLSAEQGWAEVYADACGHTHKGMHARTHTYAHTCARTHTHKGMDCD